MKRIKDMKKGNMYQWKYMGNQCVGFVTFTGPKTVRCHYAVGMWDDSDAVETGRHDYLAVDVNVAEYDITDIHDATIEQKQRYTRVVKDYQDEISMMNAEHERKDAAPVPSDSSEGSPDVYEPTKVGLKVVGHIDLDEEASRVYAHPVKRTKEEKKELRLMQEAEMRGEWTPKAAFQAIKSPSLYHYKDEEIISVSCNGRVGVAIGMVDEWHKVVGFYVAFNLFAHENSIVKWGDTVDGQIIDRWPEPITINKPNDAQRQIGDAFLMQMYRAEIDAYHASVEIDKQEWLAEQERLAEEERIRKAEEERLKAEEAERKKAEKLERAEAKAASDEDDDLEIFAGQELPHLGYIRGHSTLLDMQWPKLGDNLIEYQIFFTLSELAKMVAVCKCNIRPDETGSRTFVLTRPYLREMRSRMDEYLAQYASFVDILGRDTIRCGALCYRTGTELEQLCTILYNVEIHKNGRETIRIALLINDELQCTYRGSSQGMFGDTSPVISYACDNSPKNLRYMVDSAKKLLFTFLAMEQDASNVLHKSFDDDNVASMHQAYTIGDHADIEIRDSSWFTSILVNHATVVEGYESHRWKGHGDNKTLEPVTVSGYTKGAYTIQAKCLK